uniref:EF-hand domain-containing protein n=1 Tax=Trichobilharzia regenti TaxID=157069 RepID=A0AA85IW76_TRIRE|nr:unnamed protein product [Trichobilharzia regenti]
MSVYPSISSIFFLAFTIVNGWSNCPLYKLMSTWHYLNSTWPHTTIYQLTHSSNKMDELRALFEAADVNHSGKLSSQELKKVLEGDFGCEIPKDKFDEFLKGTNLDGEGEWSIDDLVKLFTT